MHKKGLVVYTGPQAPDMFFICFCQKKGLVVHTGPQATDRLFFQTAVRRLGPGVDNNMFEKFVLLLIKVSALVHLLCKATEENTFEDVRMIWMPSLPLCFFFGEYF